MPDRADDRRIEPVLGDTKGDAAPQPASAPSGDPTVAALEEQLKQAQAALAEAQDKFLRAKAETENVRRRADNDIAQARKFALEPFAQELLPVRDSLDLAKGFDLSKGAEVAQKVAEGLGLTLKLLDSVFQKFSIVVVDPEGQKFDPEKHQAVTMMESDTVPPNHVVKVVQKGYLINNRLLRPAMVVVAKAKEAPTSEGRA